MWNPAFSDAFLPVYVLFPFQCYKRTSLISVCIPVDDNQKIVALYTLILDDIQTDIVISEKLHNSRNVKTQSTITTIRQTP